MENAIMAGDLVRPKYAKPTGLFEVIENMGNKISVRVHRQSHWSGIRKGQEFSLSVDLVEVVKRGDTDIAEGVK